MKIGNILGILLAMIGMFLGIYFSTFPVFECVQTQFISGYQAGIYFAVIGAIIGVSCAAVGFIFSRVINNI